jgi:hypothetical protein
MTGVEVAPVGLGHMQTAPAFHRGWGRFLLAVKPASTISGGLGGGKPKSSARFAASVL